MNPTNKHTIFITGGAGYVGAMLIDLFSQRGDVETIVALDKEPIPELIKSVKNLVYIQKLTSDAWEEEVKTYAPDVVIHTAWQIREMYGDKKTQWKWNIDGSDKVFDFVFSTASVKKLIYFSTVSSYGAFPENTIEHLFKEEEGFRKTDYLYAEEKRICEEHLNQRYQQALATKGNDAHLIPQVAIIRPAAITGPRGRYMRVRFGLQAALSGQLKDSFIHRVVSLMVSFVPVTEKWCRQFIHEDDIADIVTMFAFEPLKTDYEVFNACPPGPVVRGNDMAEAVHKKPVPIPPWLIRIAFFVMWHISRGRVPTSKGGWKSYSYPIAVDGTKLTRMYGYGYRLSSKDAFVKKEGRYMKYVK